MDGKPSNSPELPLPVSPGEKSIGNTESVGQKLSPTPEKQVFSSESVSQQAPITNPSIPYPIQKPVTDPVDPSSSLTQDSNSSTQLVIADDVDVIEKEWVQKAKDIVSKTKTDPHLQTKELNRFKAEYVKQRFQKDIKLAEDV